MEYEVVIGLEVHLQVSTRSKIFCACSTDFHAAPNTNTCPICLGMPGVLPVMNRSVVDAAIATGLALNCTISKWSKMDRKNYFYPDLAKNYQISQYDLPICHDGILDIVVNGQNKTIGITRAHIEEDPARNVHTIAGGFSGVDFNRSGVPLLEIVSEPDIRSAEEAHAYLAALKQILQYIGVSDCNMEEGSLRAEPNISIRPVGQKEFGTKTEVKNVASFSGVHKAIEFEIARQKKVLSENGVIVQETRGWDADKGITVSQRSKESAHDYRYFPEPDLVPIAVDDTWVNEIRKNLPELPQARRRRFEEELGLSEYDAGVLTSEKSMADYFEETVGAGAKSKQAGNWIMGDLQARLIDAKIDIGDCKVTPANLSEMIALIEDGTISGKIGKDVLGEMLKTGKAPKEIIEERGLTQISDEGELEQFAREIIAANPGPAEEFRIGKEKVMGFFVGQMMKATKGKGNPKVINEILRRELKET